MDVIHTSIGEGYAQRFYKLCRKNGISEREFIENLVDDYYNSRFEVKNGHIELDLPFNEGIYDCDLCPDDVDRNIPSDMIDDDLMAKKVFEAVMGVIHGE